MRMLKLSLLAVTLAGPGCGASGPDRTTAPAAGQVVTARSSMSISALTGGGALSAAGRGQRRPRSAPPPAPRSAGPLARQSATAPAPRSAGPQPPPIVWNPIAFGDRRKAEMAAYVRRHYASFMAPTWRLIAPHVIVIHYTDASYSSTYNTFATDVPDSELHELPATCAHFVIDTNGLIHQLVSLGAMCRHTVGLNWTAIGIEHVGYSDAQVLGDRRQISSSLRLVRWLRCRFHIQIGNVIGHNESLSSPYHHEDVARLRSQTHADFSHTDMQVYRWRLRALGGC